MLVPIDWDNRPEKFCFVACPDEVFCECRELLAYRIHEKWKGVCDEFPKDDVGLSEPQQPKDSDRS